MDIGQLVTVLGGGGGVLALIATGVFAVLNRRAKDRVEASDKLYARLEAENAKALARARRSETQLYKARTVLAQHGIEFSEGDDDTG